MSQPQLFPDPAFHFEAVRALWYAPFNGADYGEVMTAVPRIESGDVESWYGHWTELAEAVAHRGSALLDPISRGKAHLRASNYRRTAEFFLAPEDPRRIDSYQFCQENFYAGLTCLGVDFTRSRVQYEDAEMETIFLRSPASGDNDVLAVHGGFDSTPEELYFTVGAAAIERGYHALIWEGPGQGNLLRRYGKPFTHEWERPASVALDSLAAHCTPGAVIGVGISLGGHLLARAAAFEKRFDGIVLFDFFPSIIEAFKSQGSRSGPELEWAMANGKWVFGAGSPGELIGEVQKYDDRQWASQINTNVLLLLGEDEHFFPKDLAYDFFNRLTGAGSRKIREFTRQEGGNLHCRNGAIHLAHEEIFDWIRTVVLAEKRPQAQQSKAARR